MESHIYSLGWTYLFRLVQNLALGCFTTADATLIVYLIGPEKSRPFTMAFHACIGENIILERSLNLIFAGVGFLVATFLVRPFLPEGSDKNEEVCGVLNSSAISNITSSTGTDPEIREEISNEDIPQIAWPFIITGT